MIKHQYWILNVTNLHSLALYNDCFDSYKLVLRGLKY